MTVDLCDLIKTFFKAVLNIERWKIRNAVSSFGQDENEIKYATIIVKYCEQYWKHAYTVYTCKNTENLSSNTRLRRLGFHCLL